EETQASYISDTLHLFKDFRAGRGAPLDTAAERPPRRPGRPLPAGHERSTGWPGTTAVSRRTVFDPLPDLSKTCRGSEQLMEPRRGRCAERGLHCPANAGEFLSGQFGLVKEESREKPQEVAPCLPALFQPVGVDRVRELVYRVDVDGE